MMSSLYKDTIHPLVVQAAYMTTRTLISRKEGLLKIPVIVNTYRGISCFLFSELLLQGSSGIGDITVQIFQQTQRLVSATLSCRYRCYVVMMPRANKLESCCGAILIDHMIHFRFKNGIIHCECKHHVENLQVCTNTNLRFWKFLGKQHLSKIRLQ